MSVPLASLLALLLLPAALPAQQDLTKPPQDAFTRKPVAAPFRPSADEPYRKGGVVTTAAGIDKLELGGQIRLRAETRDTFPPVKGAPSMSTQLGRFRLHLDTQVDEMVGGYLELQDSVTSLGNASTNSLHQAYIHLDDLMGQFEVQGGRFEMLYGLQRMISPLDWSNFGRAWDGGRLIWRRGDVQVDAFITQPVVGQGAPIKQNNNDFRGIYGQWKGDPVKVDVYALNRRVPMQGFDDYTLGALVRGTQDIFTWNAEGATQTGDHGPLNAGGYALAASVDAHFKGGYTFGAGYDYASGDSNSKDGNDDTFRRLFNFDHAYQGLADIVVWQNLEDIHVHGAVQLNPDWTADVALHWLSLAETRGGLFTGLGAAGAVASGTSDSLGTEVDAGVKGKLGKSFGLYVGGAGFFADNGIRNSDDQFWFFIQGQLDF